MQVYRAGNEQQISPLRSSANGAAGRAGLGIRWSSGLPSLRSSRSLRRERNPKSPEAGDIGKPLCRFGRYQRHNRGRDFAADQPLDRAGLSFAELDIGGAHRHQRGTDTSARCGLLRLDRNGLVVQVGQRTDLPTRQDERYQIVLLAGRYGCRLAGIAGPIGSRGRIVRLVGRIDARDAIGHFRRFHNLLLDGAGAETEATLIAGDAFSGAAGVVAISSVAGGGSLTSDLGASAGGDAAMEVDCAGAGPVPSSLRAGKLSPATGFSRATAKVAAGIFFLAASRLGAAVFLIFDGMVFDAATPRRAMRETDAGCLATRGRPVCATRAVSASAGTTTLRPRCARCRADDV